MVRCINLWVTVDIPLKRTDNVLCTYNIYFSEKRQNIQYYLHWSHIGILACIYQIEIHR